MKIQLGKRARQRNRNRIRTRLLVATAMVTMIVTMTASIMVYLNLDHLSKIRATGTGVEGGGNYLNNGGDILSEFTWEKDPVTSALIGPDAISCSKDAHSGQGGRASTRGLSPGPNGKDINFEIKENEIFNQDGIDISIDYRYSEKSGNFFTRGGFNFGIEDGLIVIAYKIDDKKGGTISIKEKTNYEIPDDPIFRNFRFIYDPLNGKAEVFVNSIVIWSKQHETRTPLSWKNSGNIIIGKNMNGEKNDRVIFDNLVIRTTGTLSPFVESLVNFMLEGKDAGVTLHWTSLRNSEVNSYSIERSMNGVDFVPVANVKANPQLEEGAEYTFTDKPNYSSPIIYYRLKQNLKNGKYISHGMAAIKLITEKSFSIERVNPQPFNTTFDISYFLPKSGRVWIQLTDESGKIVSTKSFEAPQGKNVHVYHDVNALKSGDYILNLIFENKKVSTVIRKI